MKTQGDNFAHDGFTLLEILVAMAILAISLTLVIEICAGGLRAAWLSKEYTKAIFLARGKMEEFSLKDTFSPGIDSGELEGGYTWKAEVKPYPIYSEQEVNENKLELSIEPFELEFELFLPSKEKKKSVKLTTLLLRKKDVQQQVITNNEESTDDELDQ
jgi:general secretion pathway protein I